MNLMRMDYFLADYLDAAVESGKMTFDEADALGERISNDIHSVINSLLWEDWYMDE
ncbi:MAG: hypothetical protein QXL94_00140 [Candidatus Parvarchaeum sp.]